MFKLVLLSTLIFSGFLALAGNSFKMLKVKDLELMMQKSSEQVFIYDANSEGTRKSDGIIPGAKLLSSISDYDVATVLPTDKKASLVFYCANESCGASHTAAERATKAGYQKVAVMSEGIEGWIKAGKPTDKKMMKN